MLLEGLQEEFVVPSVGIAAVVYLVVRGVDFGRGKFLAVLKKDKEIIARSKNYYKISVLASVWNFYIFSSFSAFLSFLS
jgi:hypothetical protein